MKRRAWLAPSLLAGAAVLVCLPIFFSRSFWLKDIVQFTYPQKWYLRERLLSGELPLWWAQVGLGRPFFALVQPGVLYPGNLLLLLPLPLGFDLFVAAHLVVGALAMRAWLKRLALPEIEATTGALLFAFAGYFVSLLAGNGLQVFGAAWIPLCLAVAAARPTTTRGQLAQAGKLALALALCLSAGEPQSVYFAGLALLTQAIARPRAERLRALGVVGLGAALAGAIGLVLLLPGAEVAAIARPGGAAYEDARHFALHPARLLELAWPGAFGVPYSDGWFVSALVDEGTGKGYLPLAAGIYLGLATPWLALGALVSRQRRPLDLALGALGLFTLLVALGEHTPLWRPFFRFFPAARLFRYPEKYFQVASLCAAFLAARGLSLAAAHPKRAARLGLGVLGLLATGAAIATLWGPALMQALVGRLGTVSPDDAGRVVRGRALWALAIGLLFWLPLRLGATGRWPADRVRLALATILAIDLLGASARLFDWAPSQIYRERSPIIDDLRRLAGPSREPERIYRPSTLDLTGGGPAPLLTRATLLPNCGVEDGIDHADGYDVFHTAAESALWGTLRSQPLKLLQATSTRWALVGDGQLGAVHPGLTLRRRYDRLHANLVEVDGAAPRVYLAEHARPVADADAAAHAMAAPEFLPGASAVIEGGEARDATGGCDLTEYRPERITLACTVSAPAYAIVADAAFPGWRARVDGADAPVLRANAAMRAVPVPAGRSAVELRYRPGGLGAGALGSLAGLAIALFLVFRAKKDPDAA